MTTNPAHLDDASEAANQPAPAGQSSAITLRPSPALAAEFPALNHALVFLGEEPLEVSAPTPPRPCPRNARLAVAAGKRRPFAPLAHRSASSRARRNRKRRSNATSANASSAITRNAKRSRTCSCTGTSRSAWPTITTCRFARSTGMPTPPACSPRAAAIFAASSITSSNAPHPYTSPANRSFAPCAPTPASPTTTSGSSLPPT